MILALSLGESVVNHFARRFLIPSDQLGDTKRVGDELFIPLYPALTGGSGSYVSISM